MALGFVATWLIITIGFPLVKPEATGITIADYGRVYFLTTAIPIGFIFVIWFDYFLDTKILVD
ncbi:MAG: hypothetical protein D6737_09235 [Chloroflexi bacterium]|nr:MAG: hypothetical protein CUN54_03055 [Phototrophicales bacterium]RMF80085.1 MAG: hypothetical protein D6737_09235 [Chloroflexota bacterium]